MSRHAALVAAVATLATGLVVGSAPEATAEQTDGERAWFEDCLGTYEPDASWFETCDQRLDDEDGYADCADWVECFRDQNQFVQTRTCDPRPDRPNQCEPGEDPLPVQWHHEEVDYRIHSGGTADIHPDEDELTDELRNSVIESFEVWNDVDCSDFQMHYQGPPTPDEPPPYYQDHIPQSENDNVVTWRDDSWPHTHYDAVALTTVTFKPSTGEILSADIEMNTADYQFTDTDDPDEIEVDMRNTLTHEVGHFLGLDHSPNSEATMWASADTGETKKRELHIADKQGVCHIYPEGEPPREPSQLDSGESDDSSFWGCSAPPAPAAPLAWVVLALLGLTSIRGRGRA